MNTVTGKGLLKRQFFFQQFLLLIFGIFFAGASIIFLRDIQRRADESHIKSEIRTAVMPSIENWRAWYSFGMNEALEDAEQNLKNRFPISNISFVTRSELGKFRFRRAIVLPEHEDQLDTYVVIEFNSAGTLGSVFSDWTTYVALISVLLLVIANIFLGFRFFSQKIYMPLIGLKNSLRDRNLKLSNLGHGEIAEIIRDITQVLKENEDLHLKREQLEKQALIGEFAAQVSHDIRSPLAALSLISGALKEIPEEKRVIIREATKRITDIANGLFMKSKAHIQAVDHVEESMISMLYGVIDMVISEKRIEGRHRAQRVQIEGDLSQGYGLFAKINPSELSRVISNLINNSIEAISETGSVRVTIGRQGSYATISIEDNGIGIPPEVMNRLGAKGFSYGKESGNSGAGLGLHHAFKIIQASGGRISIQSERHKGTTVQIFLPICRAPEWFPAAIQVGNDSFVVSVDDDETVHRIWMERFGQLGVRHLGLKSPEDLRNWITLNPESKAFFLIDQEFLSANKNGLDLISSYKISYKSILVTSRYDEPEVISRAHTLDVKVLPKNLAALVPVLVQ